MSNLKFTFLNIFLSLKYFTLTQSDRSVWVLSVGQIDPFKNYLYSLSKYKGGKKTQENTTHKILIWMYTDCISAEDERLPQWVVHSAGGCCWIPQLHLYWGVRPRLPWMSVQDMTVNHLSPVSWNCRIHWLDLCRRGKNSLLQWVSGVWH